MEKYLGRITSHIREWWLEPTHLCEILRKENREKKFGTLPHILERSERLMDELSQLGLVEKTGEDYVIKEDLKKRLEELRKNYYESCEGGRCSNPHLAMGDISEGEVERIISLSRKILSWRKKEEWGGLEFYIDVEPLAYNCVGGRIYQSAKWEIVPDEEEE